MIPILQTQFHPRGNCLMACVACILEVSLDDLPDLYQMADSGIPWPLNFFQVIKERGLLLEMCYAYQGRPRGYSIANGMGPRGNLHSCVAKDGAIEFDPHPDGGGLINIEYYWTITDPQIPAKLLKPSRRELRHDPTAELACAHVQREIDGGALQLCRYEEVR